MEALASSTTAILSSSLPIFSPLKSNRLSSKRSLCFSTPPRGNGNEPDLRSNSNESSLVPIISQDAAMGLVLSAANVRGWTTGSGMEGPSVPAGSNPETGMEQVSTFPWSLFTKSPRRRMLVAFTCKVCGQRTTRAINPHAYTDGTVFVQCCGCNIYHKLVDNLNLFHDMKCYVNSSFNPNPDNNSLGFKYFDLDDDNEDDIPQHF
nr:Hop-interacting protein THI120 [Ipomoea batatas]GME20430.1 Hop-interacting protein THI120 [Ipomoea batatas]